MEKRPGFRPAVLFRDFDTHLTRRLSADLNGGRSDRRVGTRLERGKGIDVGLFLRSVHATRREGHFDFVTGVLRGFLDRGATAENDQVGKRNLLAEFLLDRFELLQNRLELIGLVDLPVLLRAEANARTVRAAALVGAAECRGRRPGGRDQLRHRHAGGENLRLQHRDVLLSDQPVIDRRDRVLPDQASPSARAGRGNARGPPCRGG
jgi:hypothetical protein